MSRVLQVQSDGEQMGAGAEPSDFPRMGKHPRRGEGNLRIA